MTKNRFQLLSDDGPLNNQLGVQCTYLIDPLSLPTDVVSQIFYFACQPIPGDTNWRRGFYPLRLGCICRRWREVAWATSELWQTVVLRVRPGSYDIQNVLLKEWLERAKGRPLDIFFATRERSSKGRTRMRHSKCPRLQSSLHWDLPMQIFQRLRHHCEQWRRIEFHLPTSQWYYEFYRTTDIGEPRVSDPLPILDSISFHYSQSSGPDYDMLVPMLMMDFRVASTLRTMAFSSSTMIRDFFDTYPTTQITNLVLTDIMEIDLRTLLNRFPCLKAVEFQRTDLISQEFRIPAHEELNALTVNLMEEFEVFDFFDTVTFPKLKRLNIYVPSFLRWMWCFSEFFERSGCSLTSLSLDCQITGRKGFIGFLCTLPSLVELRICDHDKGKIKYPYNIDIGRHFFETLHPDMFPSYLPNLEVLSYEGPFAVQAIDYMEPLIIRSRIRGPLNVEAGSHLPPIAVLRSVTIKANQYSETSEFIMVHYTEAHYVWDVVRMLERGILKLVNKDGSKWD